MQLVLDGSGARETGRQHHGERPVCLRDLQLSLRFIQIRAAVAVLEFCKEIRVGEAGVQRIR